MEWQLACKRTSAVERRGKLPHFPVELHSARLQNIRVVQPNLVYAVGLSLDICTEVRSGCRTATLELPLLLLGAA